MKRAKKIGFWGQFGDGVNIADGQAVRTNIIFDYLSENSPDKVIHKVNTFKWQTRKFAFLFETIQMLFTCKNVIIGPADNGFKIIVPMLNIVKKLINVNAFYIVIGGFLPNMLKQQPKYIKFLKKYNTLFVQTENIKNDLASIGLTNTALLSNMKNMPIKSLVDLKVINDKIVRVCTFSRVIEEKGIIEAINAVKMSNDKLGGIFIYLDIYGVIDEKFRPKLYTLLNKSEDFASYKGIVPFNQTSKTLSDYFLMLFPTYYHGEGFAGNIVDTFFAGIPIIASDWNYNSDVIRNGVNGLLVKPKDTIDLSEKILQMYYDRDLVYKMSMENIKKASEFTVEHTMKEFMSILENY